MAWQDVFFPSYYRNFPGKRWASILLRTAHLIGMAGLSAGFLFALPAEQWCDHVYLTTGTGVGLVLIALWSNGVWLIQLQGLAIIAKLALLACIPLWADQTAAILIAVVVISGLSAHAPRRVRHFSIFHGRSLDALPDKR